MELRKWQRNQIFEAIQEAELDPRQFNLDENDGEIQIVHQLSESSFVIGGEAGHYVGRRVIGGEPQLSYEVYSWQAVEERVGSWLHGVVRDIGFVG